MPDKEHIDYSSAGVDLDRAGAATEKIKSLAAATFTKNVMGKFGGFGGAFKFDTKTIADPILISSCDGVGTKLKIAFMTGIHSTVGADLVNHCIDDIAVCGAEPLFFLDYIGTGQIDPDMIEQIVKGFATACLKAGIALIGGETAEMPDFYKRGEYDLAGFIVGVVGSGEVIDGSGITDGDVVIGFPSVGLHTNGYSLARKVFFDVAKWKVDRKVEEFGRTLGEELLVPHYSYLEEIRALKRLGVKGMAHITGGGIPGNLNRIIPDGLCAKVEVGNQEIPPIFSLMQKLGNIETREMYRAFNMGIGLVAVLSREQATSILDDGSLQAKPLEIGRIATGTSPVELIYLT
ncbi:MAG: phosphoribosylformylglycinamidine cyclo-ligase [Candidatus Zixiibacteriota bacterium]